MSANSNGRPQRPPTEWVGQVFAQLEGPLIGYVARQLRGNLEVAQDVVQEAFVKLCQQEWPRIERHHRAWLYKTCRNRVIDLTRREGRMSAIKSATDVATLRDQSVGSGPADKAQQSEQINDLRIHIRNLPERQQEILRLRLQEGLSYKQVADVTGLTVTNVGYLLHQAVTSLRAQMQAN